MPHLLIIGSYRPLSSNDIGATLSLHKEGHYVKDIAENTGINVRCWVYKILNFLGEDLTHKNLLLKPT